MVTMAERIETLLTERFSPSRLIIADDSAKHAGHAGARPGGQTHYTVEIASAHFEGLSRVAAHRAVYDALQPLFDEGLHALALRTASI